MVRLCTPIKSFVNESLKVLHGLLIFNCRESYKSKYKNLNFSDLLKMGKQVGVLSQWVEYISSMLKYLSSIPSTTKKKF